VSVTHITSRRSNGHKTDAGFGEFRMVDPKDILCDASYQRSASQKRILKIANDFDPRRFGTLDLSERKSGELYVVDGLHRKEAALIKALTRVPSLVIPCDDPKEDARRFVDQAERRSMNSAVVFRAQLKYGDTIAVMLNGLFKKYKFNLPDPKVFGYNHRDNEVGAIGMFKVVARRHGEGYVDSILYVQRHAWDGASAALGKTMILGLARLFEVYEPGHRTVVAAIKAKELDPFDVLNRAERQAYNSERRVSVVTKVADILGALVK
jgi:hypothetical protein